MTLYLGDSLEVLKSLPENSVDSIVTDPPYGISFMNSRWDYDVPSVDLWKEALRVLKPGGHLLSFGGTRTYHRMVVNIEDAGFEIRDQIQWLYGSGFPKSHNISKAIDKAAGVEREVVGINPSSRPNSKIKGNKGFDDALGEGESAGEQMITTAPATEAAKQWDGWGTALKPSNEPICLARKPLSEPTAAKNVVKWGTGGINIDECRIAGNAVPCQEYPGKRIYQSKGRWPANSLFDEEAAEMLDEQSINLHGAGFANTLKGKKTEGNIFRNSNDVTRFGDSGGASRFFYVAKASKRERDAGLEEMPSVDKNPFKPLSDPRMSEKQKRLPSKNHHPTVKPTKLMQYLIKLVTPPNGTVLDPFAGSGTTLVAAKQLGFSFIGIEKEQEYYEIARKRIEAH